ncbi:MAG TPA: hypothetical protein VHV08_07580 [Pirellulales bacterium]|jgi:hypothetical protein|nr:hypothetical protein [Pirellulales bacterium]
MSKPSPEERQSAERRIEEITTQIKAILAGDGQLDERIAQWESLLTESLHLQELLDGQSLFGKHIL